MPPKSWSRSELRRAKALDVGNVKLGNLNSCPTHAAWPLFQREAWQVEQSDYNILLPSMRLASWLLEAGLPYFYAWLPSEPLHFMWQDHLEDMDRFSEDEYTVSIIDQDITATDLNEVGNELREVAKVVKWQINGEMWRDHGWLGITRTVAHAEHPWMALKAGDIADADDQLRQAGKNRRDLVIGIAKEYVDALRNNPEGGEVHLKAVVYAAITMAHEVAHAVWHQDFRSIDYDEKGFEPWVGDGLLAEVGYSYIAWLFSKHTPELCDMGNGRSFDLRNPLGWKPQLLVSKRQLYDHWIAIPISYLEAIVQNSFWEDLGDHKKVDFSTTARQKLDPTLMNDGLQLATAHFPLWTVVPRTTCPVWKSNLAFKKSRQALGAGELTHVEIDQAISQLAIGPVRGSPDNSRPISNASAHSRGKGSIQGGRRRSPQQDDDELELGAVVGDSNSTDFNSELRARSVAGAHRQHSLNDDDDDESELEFDENYTEKEVGGASLDTDPDDGYLKEDIDQLDDDDATYSTSHVVSQSSSLFVAPRGRSFRKQRRHGGNDTSSSTSSAQRAPGVISGHGGNQQPISSEQSNVPYISLVSGVSKPSFTTRLARTDLTIADALRQIPLNTTALNHASSLGNGDPLLPHLQSLASASASQMLDSLQDLDEMRVIDGVVRGHIDHQQGRDDVGLVSQGGDMCPGSTLINLDTGKVTNVIDLTAEDEYDIFDGLPMAPRETSNMRGIYYRI